MKRKILALMLVMLYATGAWGAYYDEGNDGDSWETAYIIDSAEDLADMAIRTSYEVGKYFKLTTNIVSTYVMDRGYITSPGVFSGHFDGQNHTINLNLYMTRLCHIISSDNLQPAVRNLKLTGNIGTKSKIAPFCTELRSGIIENCSFNGTISGDYVAGIACIVFDENAIIRNCSVNADISASEDAGGILSEGFGVIENCSFSGTINSSNGEYAGGIAGEFEGNIRNCTVNANISAVNNAGGIVGEAYANIENCTVEASTRITAANVGGIAGIIYSDNNIVSGNTWPDIYPQFGNQVQTSPDVPTYTWGNHKYQIFQEALTWDEAKSKCEELGGHLATITSEEEYNFVLSFLPTSRELYWLGGRKSDNGEVWQWITGEPFTFTKWHKGEPNNQGQSEQCLELTNYWSAYNGQWGWNDESGSYRTSGFICEWETAPSSEIFTWNNHRYQVLNDALTWEQAKSRCESLGGHLVTITSQAEQSKIEELLSSSQLSHNSYWIGAKADERGFYHWVTDEVFERQYANFANGQPDGSGDYLLIDAQSRKWDDVANNTSITHGFICEFDDEPEEVKQAPLNPDFLSWQANPEAWENNDDNNFYGALPSPVDFSHLRQTQNSVKSSTFRASASGTRYDGRTKISLPAARNQGNYNTCWAFASIGALEANYLAQNLSSLGSDRDLSELHLAWFVDKGRNNNSNSNRSILKHYGTAQEAEAFLKQAMISPVKESAMPYTLALNSQNDNPDAQIENFVHNREPGEFTRANIRLIETKHIGYISNYDNSGELQPISDVKDKIKQDGAVYFQYYDDPAGYNENKTAFYSTKADNNTRHAALLVGWDDNYPIENFSEDLRPSSKGAWLVRNSRGTDFGDGGYFWMSYKQADCGESYVFVVSEDIMTIADNASDDQGLYVNQHDENGRTKNIDKQWAANIFRAGRNEDIIRVGFYTADNRTKYEIYINNFKQEKPTDPGGIENLKTSGEFNEAGYHVIDLPEPVELYEGDYYSVIVKMTLSSGYEYPTGVEAFIDKYVSPDVRPGESFFASGDVAPSIWQDGTEIDGGPFNACIEAATLPRYSYVIVPEITTNSLPEASQGETYNFELSYSGTSPVEWRLGNIPSGMKFSRDGVLSGTPSEAGEYELKITALNDAGSDTKTFTLKVNASEDNNDNEDNPPEEPDNPLQEDNPSSEHNLASSSGGCNSGFEVLCVLSLLAVFTKRR